MNLDDAGRVARAVLDHPYRRALLALLDSAAAPVALADLARAVPACDPSAVDAAGIAPALAGGRGVDLPAYPVETMAAQLHHSHLPRLAAVGLLRYDADDGLVREWRHPPVGDRWLTSPPVARLAAVIAAHRASAHRAVD
jgi:hypothetical protein